MKRRLRAMTVFAAVVTSGVLIQGCLPAVLNIGLAGIDFCSLLGPNCVLGPIAPCGNPNTTADDLLVDCPPPNGITP